ncbi:MAG TPA: hypothetical protein P5218_16465, partial [Planctomycetota bacterium]|nr:hypothetical protein [Planctomycetota bacterium]
SWSVPAYSARPQFVQGLEIRAGDLAATSVVVEDVAQIAEKNLSDRMLYLSVRSAVRSVLKQNWRRRCARNTAKAPS